MEAPHELCVGQGSPGAVQVERHRSRGKQRPELVRDRVALRMTVQQAQQERAPRAVNLADQHKRLIDRDAPTAPQGDELTVLCLQGRRCRRPGRRPLAGACKKTALEIGRPRLQSSSKPVEQAAERRITAESRRTTP